SDTSPDVLLAALKLPAVFAPPSVVPPAELVVSSPVVLTRPPPLSLSVMLAVRLTAPPPAPTVPVSDSAPVWLTLTAPPPAWPIPVSAYTTPFRSSDTSPDVLLAALKLPTVFAPPSVVPPTELVVRIPVVLIAPAVWPIVP